MANDAKPLSPPLRVLRSFCVLTIIAICGWLVMELEILGGRMLHPFFGSSVYIWGSVIGVFLLSLSFGYLLGGWISNFRAREVLLGAALALAGAWIFCVHYLLAPVCDWLWDRGMDGKWGSLTAALILFALPSVLLATASPTAVRWLTREARQSGLIAGFVLFFSTVASFAGCVVTSFYLVLYSVRLTFQVSGAVLCAVGLALIAHWIAAALLRRGAVEAAGGGEPQDDGGSRDHG